jgi:hypothetical protein
MGRWFRQIGANALIYPSARTDVECILHNGKVTLSRGWNLVDYRGAPEPDQAARIIMAPDSWWGLLGAYTNVQILGDGQSWRIVGPMREQMEWFHNQQKRKAQELADRFQRD